MASLAQVYILDIPYGADKPYTYYFHAPVAPGDLVEVPFGKGNRVMTAVVFAVTEGEPEEKTKPIAGICVAGILSAEMLGLCLFIKEYTLCTFGEAVRAVTPQAALAKVVQYYRIAAPLSESEELALPLRTQQIYRFMLERKQTSRQMLRAHFTFDCTAPLDALLRDGVIVKATEMVSPSAGKTKSYLAVSDDCRRAVQETDADTVLTSLRGENPRRILAVFLSDGDNGSDTGGIAEDTLIEQSGLSRQSAKAALRTLLERGYLVRREEVAYRNPFALTEPVEPAAPPALSEEQSAALSTICALCDAGTPKAALLHGVTGSGKTNVMLAAIDHVLAGGRGVICLVPEIALTPQTVSLYRARFGDRIAVIHSGLSGGERLDAWRRIRDGEADVVIGTRSAVFAPVARLGMILIDEEHEYTYKSETNPKYSAHDIARYRCGYHNAVMLLASATPSLLSYYKAQNGIYTLISLTKRYGNAKLPSVTICDMRGESPSNPVGTVLAERLMADKAAGNQSILFLNRRGYHKFVSCRSCGKSIQCPNCSVSMTYHANGKRGHTDADTDGEGYLEEKRHGGYLVCHMCGYRTTVPDKCPVCGKDKFLFMGCGTQKAEDDIASLFPDLRIVRMDLDTTRGKFSHEELLQKFRSGEADVLLGTQMVTKGHDFPRVATVGVLNADGALLIDDYRANERTFALLTQVIGRAGRGEIPGQAIIQTWNPDSEVLHLAARQDYRKFYEGEIRLRKALCFPPFCDIAVLTVSGYDEGFLNRIMVRLRDMLLSYIADEFRDVPLVLYGPFEAPVYRVQNVYRMRFVVKCRLNKRTRAFFDRLLVEFGKPSSALLREDTGNDERAASWKDRQVHLAVDLNPTSI